MKRRKFFKTIGSLAVATQISSEIFGQDVPESVMTTDEYGNKFWHNSEDKLHRTNGPAIESKEYNYWCLNGNCYSVTVVKQP